MKPELQNSLVGRGGRTGFDQSAEEEKRDHVRKEEEGRWGSVNGRAWAKVIDMIMDHGLWLIAKVRLIVIVLDNRG